MATKTGKEREKKADSKRKPKSEEDDDGGDSDGEEVGAAEQAKERNPKGDELVKQAEKRLKALSVPFFSSGSKFEDAVELYDKAAAQYKITKNWQEAAEVYMKAAELSEKLKNSTEATQYYANAAKAYKHVDIKECIKVLQLIVETYTENNRFSAAAKVWKEIGELQEKELNYKAAQQAWQKAANMYEAEDQTASGNQCLIKVATIAAEHEEDYKQAIEILEQVAKASLDSNLGKWSVKDYFYKALLCHFVLAARDGDLAPVEEALEKYKDLQPQFENSRECTLIEKCVAAFKDENEEAFTDAVFQHNEIYKLDNWSAKVLLEIKKRILEGGDGDKDIDDLR